MNNKIDWSDPRAVGLKCEFTNNNTLKEFEVSSFKEVTTKYKGNHGFLWNNINLKKGDKKEYVGGGQPVPDNVMVKVWSSSGYYTGISNHLSWTNKLTHIISHYQVIGEEKMEEPDNNLTGGLIPVNLKQQKEWEAGNDVTIKGREQWYDKSNGKYIACWVSDIDENPSNDCYLCLIGWRFDELQTNNGETWNYVKPLTQEEKEKYLF